MKVRMRRGVGVAVLMTVAVWMTAATLWASGPAASPTTQEAQATQTVAPKAGGEAALKLPDLSQVSFMGVDGHTLLLAGILVSALGLLFGLVISNQLKNMPVHSSMREVSELIYETCKTYLIQQG